MPHNGSMPTKHLLREPQRLLWNLGESETSSQWNPDGLPNTCLYIERCYCMMNSAELIRRLLALDAGEQCTAPTTDNRKHASTGTLRPHRIVPILYNGQTHAPPSSKVPFPWGSRPNLIHGYFGTRVYTPSSTSIGSAVFTQFTGVPNTQTETDTQMMLRVTQVAI